MAVCVTRVADKQRDEIRQKMDAMNVKFEQVFAFEV